MQKALFLLLSGLISAGSALHANTESPSSITRKTAIIGGGIIGALEAYYAYQEAQKDGENICITVYEKGAPFDLPDTSLSSTNTAYNIVPSLTPDEILSVVPRGTELMEKLTILFSQPGGIRVDDVVGANDSPSAIEFKEAVTTYGTDPEHDERKLALLQLGKHSMQLWQQMYDEGDSELKDILEASNFNPCRNPRQTGNKTLHDGYRIDLIYGIGQAQRRALEMQSDYEKLGYTHCTILSPDEVLVIDPFLSDFCNAHSLLDSTGNRIWQEDAVALWRPGGCIDTRTFLPRFYAYLTKLMGQYEGTDQELQDRFQLQCNHEVIGLELDPNSEDRRIVGLTFSNGFHKTETERNLETQYIFCPGESVGTLRHLGFHEPTYAAFAGSSLLLTCLLSADQLERYQHFSHCMEVHNEGIVLAWQARVKNHHLFIGVAGTKAFYGDKQPHKEEAFAKNRNLVQLNMVNDVLPSLVSLICGYDTQGKPLSAQELFSLEIKGLAHRWVGRRAVAYDGFPTLGALYFDQQKVSNARCTTHLGSGGVSFGPGAVWISRCSEQESNDPFVQKILGYADSRRTP